MQLMILLSFLAIFQSICSTEYEVKELIRFERNLIDSLDNYFKRQEKNGITFESEVTSFVQNLQVKNEELSDKISRYYENPISRYHVTKRLVTDWLVLKENLTCTGTDCPLLTGEDVFKAVFKREKRGLPTEHDLEEAALTLLYIWDIYDLDLAEIAEGRILDVQEESLSADDLFFIASVAKDFRKYYSAIKWYEFLLMTKDDIDQSGTSFQVAFVYRRLASSYHAYGMTWKAVEILEEFAEIDANNTSILNDLDYFKSFGRTDKVQTEVKRYRAEDTSQAKTEENYRTLCQRSPEVTNSTTQFSCYLQPLDGTYGFSKQEILSLRPRIVLIYDVVDNSETKVLLRYAEKHWQTKSGYSKPGTQSKAWKSPWYCERRLQYPFLDHLTSRIEAMTKFKLWPFQDNPSSQCYQYRYRGVGETSVVESDYWSKEQSEAWRDGINCYATIKIQLSDVQYGGATIFPKLGIHVPIIKNSAVIWWNLKNNGTPNPKTVHRDCPVVIGTSWAISKHVFYRNQINLRKCSSRKHLREDKTSEQDSYFFYSIV